MPDIPDDGVMRRGENPVEGYGKLDDTEVRGEVAPIRGHDLDDSLPKLTGEMGEVAFGDMLEVVGG
jgi:hypothetical protein